MRPDEKKPQRIERWLGRSAVVTGASSGIGAAVGHALADAGLRVVLVGRREQRLHDVRARICAETRAAPDDVLVVPADLRDEAAILRIFDAARAAFGGVDVLINNAGLGHLAPLCSGETEKWREMLDVNVLALCIASREAIRDLERRAVEGHVIHVSSMAAHRVPQDSGMYAASKHAVRALTEALRQELWQKNLPIRVSSISPAFVETEFAAHYHGDPAAAQRTYGRYRVLQTDDIARAVIYALGEPLDVQVHDILLRPRRQPT